MMVLYGPKTSNLEILCSEATLCRIFIVPSPENSGSRYAVMAAIVPTRDAGPLEGLGREYRVIQRVPGRMAAADADLLLTKMRQDGVVIRFHQPVGAGIGSGVARGATASGTSIR